MWKRGGISRASVVLRRPSRPPFLPHTPQVRALTLDQYLHRFGHHFPYGYTPSAPAADEPAAPPPRRGVQFSPSAASPPPRRDVAAAPDRTVVRPGGMRRAPPAAAAAPATTLTTTIKAGRGRAPAVAAFAVPLPDGTTITLDPADAGFEAALAAAKEAGGEAVREQLAAVMRSAQAVFDLLAPTRRRGGGVSRGSLSAPGTE